MRKLILNRGIFSATYLYVPKIQRYGNKILCGKYNGGIDFKKFWKHNGVEFKKIKIHIYMGEHVQRVKNKAN